MIYNILLMTLFVLLWDFIVFILCKHVKRDKFDSSKNSYKEKNFEKGGNFYSKTLKIKKWKDLFPQYVSKDGFSKRNFESKSIHYINEFIMETCRAEWCHKMCLAVILPIIIINQTIVSFIVSVFVILTHLPIICIQRYNRFRLEKVKRKIMKCSLSEALQ